MTVRHVTGRAGGIVSLPDSDPEREAAVQHARECTPCARELEQARRSLALLEEALVLPPPSPAAMKRAAEAVLSEMDRGALPAPPRPIFALVASWLLFAAVAKHRVREPVAWLGSVAVVTLAAACVVAAPRWRTRAAALACIASGALAMLAGSGGDLAALLGVKCVAIELVAAALPYATAVRAAARLGSRQGAGAMAAIAAAGALAGQASLHLTCPERSATPHLLVFHTGGVLFAAVLGALGASRLPRRVRAT
jgi:hypothetical protein